MITLRSLQPFLAPNSIRISESQVIIDPNAILGLSRFEGIIDQDVGTAIITRLVNAAYLAQEAYNARQTNERRFTYTLGFTTGSVVNGSIRSSIGFGINVRSDISLTRIFDSTSLIS